MNLLLKQLGGLKETPKVSLFLEWKTVNHDFEEVRIWLHHASEAIRSAGKEPPPILLRIMEDQRIFGSELNIANNLTLGEEYAALFMSGEDIISASTPFSVKDHYFWGDEFFVLPLLEVNPRGGALALFVQQDSVRALKASGYKRIVDITDQFRFPEGIAELAQFSMEPEETDQRRNYREELLRKYAREIAAEVARVNDVEDVVHIFAAPKVASFLKTEIEKNNRNFEVMSHSMVMSPAREANRIRKLLIEKVLVASALNGEMEEDFKKAPVTSLNEVLWAYDMGNLKSLRLNRQWLYAVMNDGHTKTDLVALNRFVLNCLRRKIDVRLSGLVNGIFAGELHGNPVKMPTHYQSQELGRL